LIAQLTVDGQRQIFPSPDFGGTYRYFGDTRIS